MKLPIARLLPLILLGGCMVSPLQDPGGKTPETAADGSSTPLTQAQALTIARAEIAKREGWPAKRRSADGRTHGVFYIIRRINHGCYRVEAQRLTRYPNHSCELYDPTPPAVMVIDREGDVIHYALGMKNG